MDKASTAWLAGLFEGEGCISFTGKSSVCVTIKMSDRDVIERCRTVSGVGRIYGPWPRPSGKPMWEWNVYPVEDVERLLQALLPWLGERRRAKALAAVERLAEVRRPGFCK